jgi:hypothetical protein
MAKTKRDINFRANVTFDWRGDWNLINWLANNCLFWSWVGKNDIGLCECSFI